MIQVVGSNPGGSTRRGARTRKEAEKLALSIFKNYGYAYILLDGEKVASYMDQGEYEPTVYYMRSWGPKYPKYHGARTRRA